MLCRNLAPPLLWNLVRGLRSANGKPMEALRFTGDYQSWEEATRDSEGYDAPGILARTRAAILKVKRGEAAYERDSVLFDQPDYQYPLLACLMHVALANGGRLSVLDFGGALGSSYFQCLPFLRRIKELRWSVVEQAAHVACGQAEIADEHLQFYLSIRDALTASPPTVLLLSAVVQCLPAPYEFLDEVLANDLPWVIVDRTPFLRSGRTRLTVQHVPASIYRASYPSWFLSESRFLECFRSRYERIATFPALDRLTPEGDEADYKGFLFQRKERP